MPHSLTDLADYLRDQRDATLRRLQERCSADPHLPAAKKLSYDQFLDHLPPMLDRLDAALREDSAAPEDAPADDLALKHGEQRRGAGYTVDQVLCEMADLHTALMEGLEDFFRAHPGQSLETAIVAARRVGSFVMDEAARSADGFSRAETAARDKARMEALLAQMPLGVLFTDSEGRVVQMNDAARVAVGGQALLGAPVESLANLRDPVSDAVMPWDQTPIGRALRGQSVENLEANVELSDGDHVCYLFNAGALRDADGAVTGAVAVCQDISVRKRAEAVLKEADRSKDRFLALVSHEMRDPVSAIVTSVGLLREESAGPARRAQARAVIERSARKIERLVEDLLDVARITQNKVVLHRAPLRLEQIAARVLDDMEPRIRAKGLHLARETDTDVWVNGDALRLEQVLSNVIGNAVKYTERGVIHVSVRRGPDEAVIVVSDTGIGIAPESVPELFDMFVQANSSLPHSGGGLGLGLSLVRSFTEMHGGTVSARSDGPGRGATVTVTIPLCAPGNERAEEHVPAPESVRARRVLLVDDNPDAREIMSDILEIDGYEIFEAADGRAAVETAIRERPDIALLDIGLPGMDGYEVAARLRAQPDLAGLRLVAITGYGQDADKEHAKDSGFDAHLTKPVDLESLRALLARLLKPPA